MEVIAHDADSTIHDALYDRSHICSDADKNLKLNVLIFESLLNSFM